MTSKYTEVIYVHIRQAVKAEQFDWNRRSNVILATGYASYLLRNLGETRWWIIPSPSNYFDRTVSGEYSYTYIIRTSFDRINFFRLVENGLNSINWWFAFNVTAAMLEVYIRKEYAIVPLLIQPACGADIVCRVLRDWFCKPRIAKFWVGCLWITEQY